MNDKYYAQDLLKIWKKVRSTRQIQVNRNPQNSTFSF